MIKVFVGWLMGVLLVGAELKELPWAAIDEKLLVWTPEDFDPAKKWPAIVFFHGTNGKPTVDLMRYYTGDQHFVIVGMTYQSKGRPMYDAQTIGHEMGLLNALKQMLVESFAVDPGRIYVAGFSKGGWHSALLLERDRSLAGGLVLGGGVFEAPNLPPVGKFGKKVPIYIGSGRYDGNYPQSLRALVQFRKLGAEVTQEAWPEVGHQYPKERAEGMAQWLRVQAGGEGLELAAREWIAERKGELVRMEDPVERWLALEEFQGLPFVTGYGAEEAAWAAKEVKTVMKDPVVVAEKKWRDESRGILRVEIQDRRVSTLEKVVLRYQKLAEEAQGTRAGEEAANDVARTMGLLSHTKEVEEEKVRTPVEVPSGPVEQPGGRGGFPLMPGTKVKPAK